jgi:exodeoxyribonuclease VII large subunit
MAESTHNQPDLSVSGLAAALKASIESAFGLVRVRGEISQPKVVASGHCYLRLKDAHAVLEAVIWRGSLARLSVRPEDGLEVIATGRLTTYGARSQYQMIVEAIEVAGEGALLKLLEERKRKLAAEGLFAAERKRPIPTLPTVIGVVTSPTGAVIRDILHRLRERFPRHVLLWPVRVQGEGAAAEIAAAIAGFDALPPDGPIPRPDLLIVARGGGSLEDLWPFNEEIVVRAASACSIPLISAVGHETDTTLIDYAADLRAPTPTGAAEKAVPVRLDLLARVGELAARLPRALVAATENRARHLEALARGLPQPERLLAEATQRLDDRAERLDAAARRRIDRDALRLGSVAARLRTPREVADRAAVRLSAAEAALARAFQRRVETAQARLDHRAALLESLSYRRVLDRGFVLVRDAKGAPLIRAAEVAPGAALSLVFADGAVAAAAHGAKPVKPGKTDPRQGSLL